ncbi:MAG: methyltransferase domain-containing protein [Chloroflexales bacterium]|nr:methyltransferase domain-containing protein [Chloroflexales bacterium]
MSKLAVGTVVAKNYLAVARVLAQSFQQFHPDIPFFVALADEPEGRFDPRDEPFHLLTLAELALPDLERMRFRYTRQQLIIATKPFLLSALLGRGFAHAIALDADMLVLDDLTPLFDRVRQHALALTPHLLEPPADALRIGRELNILQSGIFNGGFVGITNQAEARHFLSWWQERVAEHCHHAVGEGMYYDQRWLDFAPTFVADCHVVRDPAYNVAYWNLPERQLHFDGERAMVAGQPCRFFHFSGYDYERPDAPTRYNRALTFDQFGTAARLFTRYQGLLEAANHPQTSTWPYAYDRFHNGVAIPDVARRLYAALGAGQNAFGDPFAPDSSTSFFAWLQQPADLPADPAAPISRLWHGIYQQRADLQAAFPDLGGADRHAFLTWAATRGAHEYALPDILCAAAPTIDAQLERTPPLDENEAAIRAQIDAVAYWYHRIPIRPGIVTPGVNDCATTLGRLRLPTDCHGLRVLDLGACDGFFAFELERRGAEVVAVDYKAAEQSGFAVAAELMGYKGVYIQENIYNLSPERLGTFDIVLFLGLLYHLPDPLRALWIVRSLCRDQLYLETYVIDQQLPLPDGSVAALETVAPLLRDVPLLCFMPGRRLNDDPTNYWGPNMKCLELMLGETMFEVADQQLHGDRAIIAARAKYDAQLDHYGTMARGAALPKGPPARD